MSQAETERFEPTPRDLSALCTGLLAGACSGIDLRRCTQRHRMRRESSHAFPAYSALEGSAGAETISIPRPCVTTPKSIVPIFWSVGGDFSLESRVIPRAFEQGSHIGGHILIPAFIEREPSTCGGICTPKLTEITRAADSLELRDLPQDRVLLCVRLPWLSLVLSHVLFPADGEDRAAVTRLVRRT